MLNVLECKHCHAPLPEKNFSGSDDVVVCEYCGTVHYLNETPVAYPPEKPKREKSKRSKPDKFTLNKMADGLEIRYRWLGKQHTGLLFFGVIWNAFIIFFTVMMVGGMMSDGSFEVMMFCFLTPFYAVGIGMAYYVLTGFMNHTSIQIRGGSIDTVHAPIPTFGTSNNSIDRRSIEQVYCTRRVAYSSNDVPVYVFDVHYVKKGGEDKELVKGLDSLHKAVYIEQQIEHLYRISDVPVDGEYRSQF